MFSDDDDQDRTYQGSTTASAGGQWAFNAGHALTGPKVAATATDAAGNTSPFSPPFDGQVIGGSVYTGHTCRAEDVDCNGSVDVYDIQQVAGAWNTRAGDPGYGVWLDQNQDGAVIIVDIMLVAAAWAP